MSQSRNIDSNIAPFIKYSIYKIGIYLYHLSKMYVTVQLGGLSDVY